MAENYSYFRIYVEELIDGEYVQVEDSVQDIYIKFFPDIQSIEVVSNGLQINTRRLLYATTYLDDDYAIEYWTEYANIYRKTSEDGSWKLAAEHIPNEGDDRSEVISWVDTDVKNGRQYIYSYRSYRPVALEPYDGKLSDLSPSVIYYYLNQPKGLTIKNSSSGKTMTISWNRNNKAGGYEIQYKTSKNTYTRTVSGYKNHSLKLKNRTPNKQYWVQVRSYKTVNGTKYYSAWSAVKTRYAK